MVEPPDPSFGSPLVHSYLFAQVSVDISPLVGAAGSCWMWGKDDELGRFNLLTPARTAAAARLIETGDRVSLKSASSCGWLPCMISLISPYGQLESRSSQVRRIWPQALQTSPHQERPCCDQR